MSRGAGPESRVGGANAWVGGANEQARANEHGGWGQWAGKGGVRTGWVGPVSWMGRAYGSCEGLDASSALSSATSQRA